MNANDRDNSKSELEAIYRADRDVEPDPGLDRMIRARAEQASRNRRIWRPPVWVGGLATASVMIAVVTVVMQQPDAPSASREAAPTMIESAVEPSAEAENFASPSPSSPQPAARSAAEPATEAAAGADRLRARPMADQQRASELRETGPSDPARALEAIRDALAAGRIESARERLQEFRARFPGHELPEDLARRLEEG